MVLFFLVFTFIFKLTEIDDFIVDEQGQPVSKAKKKKKHIHSDS